MPGFVRLRTGPHPGGQRYPTAMGHQQQHPRSPMSGDGRAARAEANRGHASMHPHPARTRPCTTPRLTRPPLTAVAEPAGANCLLTSSRCELEQNSQGMDGQAMKMQSKKLSMNLDAPLIYPALLLLIVFALSLFAVDGPAATTVPATQVTFATPTEAGQALQAANGANNEVELRTDSRTWIRRMSSAREIPLQTRPPVSRL